MNRTRASYWFETRHPHEDWEAGMTPVSEGLDITRRIMFAWATTSVWNGLGDSEARIGLSYVEVDEDGLVVKTGKGYYAPNTAQVLHDTHKGVML